jgi:hypothetical protein
MENHQTNPRHSWYHYKVFTHLWQPPNAVEARLVVVSKTKMTPGEVKDVLVRSGRAVAGKSWIEEAEAGEIPADTDFETPEDYLLIGTLPSDTLGEMPPRPTERDATLDYPFELRA